MKRVKGVARGEKGGKVVAGGMERGKG